MYQDVLWLAEQESPTNMSKSFVYEIMSSGRTKRTYFVKTSRTTAPSLLLKEKTGSGKFFASSSLFFPIYLCVLPKS